MKRKYLISSQILSTMKNYCFFHSTIYLFLFYPLKLAINATPSYKICIFASSLDCCIFIDLGSRASVRTLTPNLIHTYNQSVYFYSSRFVFILVAIKQYKKLFFLQFVILALIYLQLS